VTRTASLSTVSQDGGSEETGLSRRDKQEEKKPRKSFGRPQVWVGKWQAGKPKQSNAAQRLLGLVSIEHLRLNDGFRTRRVLHQ